MYRRILGLGLVSVLALPAVALAQTRQISGTVQRTGGGPIAAAVVSVAGTTETARTDAEGRYTVSAPTGEVRLSVRAIGFTRKDAVVAASQNTVDFLLDPDVFKLEEVVVSGQATTVQRRNATTSIGYVSGEDLTKVASPTIESALYGKLAGVNIQGNGGAPGGGMQMQIRGSNTILGNFDPLYVIDGVIYSNASILNGRNAIDAGASVLEDNPVNRLADINPADIASIEVLKGAAAAAIYGSKAASGVVVIKTIRGQIGAPKVDVSQRLGTFDRLRGYQDRCLSSVADVQAQFGGTAAAYVSSLGGSVPCYQHYDQVWGLNRVSYETVADVNGGDSNTRYFVSTTFKRDAAIEPNTQFGRQALRVNLDQSLGKKIDVSVSSVFNRSTNSRGWDNNCNNFACYGYALAYIPSYIDLRQQADGSYINPANAGTVASNPLQTAALSSTGSTTNRFTGGTTITWKARTTERSSLRFIAAGGADLFHQNDNLVAPVDLFFEQIQAQPGASIENNGDSRQFNWNLNGVWTYRTAATGGMQFTTSGGVQYEDRWLHTSRITTTNLVPGQVNVNQGSNFAVTENLTPEKTFAFYGQEDLLMLNDRLLISGGIRAERSSANGNISKYYVYPRLSGKYSFRDVLGEGSEFKIRAAYGELGNQPNFGQKFTNLNTPQFGGTNGFQVGTVSGDPNIAPERVKEIEGGFDLNFWNGRANLDVSLYNRKTTDLLLSRSPAPSTGYTTQFFNGGEIQNKGIEIVAGITPIQQRDFNWISSTSFTLHRSKVLSLPVPSFRPPASGFGGLGVTFIEVGQSLSRLYGPRYATPGDASSVYQGTVGNTDPTFRVGFQNSVTYKSFNFSVTADWQKGGNVVNLTQFLLDDGKTTFDYGTAAYDARSAAVGDGVTTIYVEPADFFKLREVSLSWNLPRSFTDALGWGLHDARIGVTGRDLFWWTKYSGLDPEVANFGSSAIRSNTDVTPYPPSRSIFFNLAVGF